MIPFLFTGQNGHRGDKRNPLRESVGDQTENGRFLRSRQFRRPFRGQPASLPMFLATLCAMASKINRA